MNASQMMVDDVVARVTARINAPTRGGVYYVDIDPREKVEFAIAGGRTSVGSTDGLSTRMQATLNLTIRTETPLVLKSGGRNDECADAVIETEVFQFVASGHEFEDYCEEIKAIYEREKIHLNA